MALIATAETTETGISIWDAGSTVVSEESVWKRPVRAASTANVADPLTAAPATIDGVTLADGDRILLKDQSTASTNGIYRRVSASVWERASDYEAGAVVEAGVKVYVQEGTTHAKQTFRLASPTTAITVGSTPTTWENDAAVTNGWASETVTTSSSASSAEFDMFDQTNYGGTPPTTNVTANNVTYTPADGRFTADVDGIYKLEAVVYLTTSATAAVNLRVRVNGSQVWIAAPLVNSNADPEERTISLIRTLSAGDYVEFTADSATASTVTIVAGTTANIQKIG
jgi:hypothetical protein